MSEQKILNPTSGNKVNIAWALRQGVIDHDGNYLKNGEVVRFADILDPKDVHLTSDQIEQVEAETRVLTVEYVAAHNASLDAPVSKSILTDTPRGNTVLSDSTTHERDDELLHDSEGPGSHAAILRELRALGMDTEALEQAMLQEGFNMAAVNNILADMKNNPQPPSNAMMPGVGAALSMPQPSPMLERYEEYAYDEQGNLLYEYATVFTDNGGMRQVKQPRLRRIG